MSKHFMASLSAFFVALALSVSAPIAFAQTYYGTPFPGPRFGVIEENKLNEIGRTNMSFSGIYRGLAYRTVDKELYAEIRDIEESGAPSLVIMDIETGNTKRTIRLDTGRAVGGMTYDPAADVFYTIRNPQRPEGKEPFLGTSDPTTGVVTNAENFLPGTILGIANDPATGILYGAGVINGSHNLVTIDKQTGQIASTIKEGLDLPQVQSMTIRDGKFLVSANSEGTPGTIGTVPNGGKELWEISMDGETVTLLNDRLGENRVFQGFVTALEFIPEGTDIAIIAGDGNLDGKFDTADIVGALGGNLFEMDADATWEQGDWNGAPNPANTYADAETGGGTPPPGDNRFNTNDIVAALAGGTFETGSVLAALKDPAKGEGTGQVVVSYDAVNGNVSVDASQPITSISLESASGIFTGDPAENLGGPFDVDTDVKVFKAVFGGDFSEVDFGTVAAAGLPKDLLLNDLTASGSLAGGGGTYGPDVQLNYIPEPSTFWLGLLATAALVGFRHKRRTAE